MDIALSDKQVLALLRGKANLITYAQVKNYRTLEQLMGPYKACVILYETRKSSGHWTCIFEVNKDLVEFFDPYSIMIDKQLQKINPAFKRVNNMNHTYLSNLLYNSHYPKIEYNHYDFQKRGKNINTCGRHVIVRLWLRELNLEQYNDFIKSFGLPADYVVTQLTNL